MGSIPTSSTLNGSNGNGATSHLDDIFVEHQIQSPVEQKRAAPTPGKDVSPIAIIGMACRVSGDVSSAEELWQLCSRARSGWSPIPKERWSQQGYYHANASKTGTYNAQGAHFIQEDVGLFDAPFFNISASEARSIDPQQRLMLECTYEALENAGVPKEKIVGHNVGVFVGGSFADYSLYCLRDADNVPAYEATGTAQSVLSNRVSYYFDLKGPSVTVDTACSSTLAALHLACQSLRSGESSTAIVGGSHLNLVPEIFISMSNSRLLSPSGKSYSFDDRAEGFGRGEGIGCIILKNLDNAIRDGDKIRAVIRNTGMNQDGRTQGISMPNGTAQAELIRHVYESAGLDPQDTGYVEAHGTGTKVGDPIEATALHSVFGESRTPKNPLFLGSVKSNIGHAEGSSGIVAVIKTAMMLEKGFILPNINFKKPNPAIPLSEWNMKVPKSQVPWPRNKRYASINNFGFGGTNCHVVLEGPPKPSKTQREAIQASTVQTNDLLKDLDLEGNPVNKLGIASHKIRFLFVLSANSEKSVGAQMQNLQMYLEQRPETLELSLMGKLAYTLGQRRSSLSWKTAISAATSSELIQKLSNPDLKAVASFGAPSLSFVFTGQGAQWHAMGRELMGVYPVFASTIVMADSYLASLGSNWSLIAELQKNAKETLVDQAYVSQPACTAIQIALVRLLASWGIKPASVIGHSSGEIAAAFAAGVLSLKDCLKIAYFRGLTNTGFKSKYPDLCGRMMAVGAGPEEVQPLLKTVKSGRVVIACFNSPSSVTVSGDNEAIEDLQPLIEEKGLFNRKLRVDMAYHSHHMELVAEEYFNAISDIKPRQCSPGVKYFSSVTGIETHWSDLGASYWVKNLVSPVQFMQALRSMATGISEDSQHKSKLFIELGPHEALKGPVNQTLKFDTAAFGNIEYAATLIRNRDAIETTQELAAILFSRGLSLHFEAINFPQSRDKTMGLLTDLPRYPWQHNTRYWHESRIADNRRYIRQFPRNDILGAEADDSNDLEPRWRNIIRLEDMPWLRDHQIQGAIVYPMAGYVTMAMEAAYQRASIRNIKFDRYEFREISANRALIIEENKEIETMITLRPYNEGTKKSTDSWDEFRIFAWVGGKGWTEHCRGLVGVQKEKAVNPVDGERQLALKRQALNNQISKMEENCNVNVDIEKMASNLKALGVYYGPAFQSFVQCKTGDQFAVAEVELADTSIAMPKKFEPELIMHPAHLDLIIQILWPLLGAGRTGWDKIYMPSGFKRLSISPKVVRAPGSRLRVYGTSPKLSPTVVKPVDLDVFATQSNNPEEACVILEGYTITPVNHDSSNYSSNSARDLCYKMSWETFQADTVSPPSELLAEEVEIVTADDSTGVEVCKLQAALQKVTGKLPIVRALSEVEPEGKIVIMLDEATGSLLSHVTPEKFLVIQKIILGAKGLLWVVQGAYEASENPNGNMAIGLARTIREETQMKFATLDLGLQTAESRIEGRSVVAEVFALVFSDSDARQENVSLEFMERNGVLHIPKVVVDEDMNKFVHQQLRATEPELQPFAQRDRSLKMIIGNPGLLDTIHFIDDYSLSAKLPEDYVEIEVKAVGLNFKDVMIAMGHLANEHIGIECSGVVSKVGSDVTGFKIGERVCAIAEGSFASHIRCRATSVSRIDESLTFESACTLPVIWSTALYSLIHVAHLEKGESVLIHAAAGGVGQAAIILAQMIGAEIFVTVGSPEKKAFLMETYNISQEKIFFSRDTSFASQIQTATKGKGVDVVLNSLAGDALLATWQCLASFGRFVEIGKRDIVTNTRLEMATFAKNVTFSSVDLVVVLAERPKLMQRLLTEVMELYMKGIVKVITPLSVYSISNVESGFRSLQSGKNLGKIAITLGERDMVKAVPAKLSDTLLKEDATYVIIGGTGGLGRSITRWMSQKGAKHIVLASRSSTLSSSVQTLIDSLALEGTQVLVRQCNVSDEEEVKKLVAGLSGFPPIRGVIHSAMVLHDILFEKMSYDDYTKVVQPKVAGAWYLHKALGDHPLDFFIMLSSAAGIIGNKGQAAYSAANTFMNAFAQYRIQRGLPATAIDLAAVSDVGYLAENLEKKDLVMGSMGSEGVNELELHALLATAISDNMITSNSNHCITGLDIIPGSEVPSWMSDAKFASIRPKVNEADPNTAAKLSLRDSLKQASSREDAENLVYAGLVEKVSAILMIAKVDIDGRQPIATYGLDSLVAVEIRNWVTRETAASLQVLELLSSGSLIALSQIIVKKSALVDSRLLEKA